MDNIKTHVLEKGFEVSIPGPIQSALHPDHMSRDMLLLESFLQGSAPGERGAIDFHAFPGREHGGNPAHEKPGTVLFIRIQKIENLQFQTPRNVVFLITPSDL
jgi:hypothetical protein